MHKHILTCFLPVILLAALAGSALAREATDEQCEKWQAKVDYYTDLRRNGGSATQMDTWKREREEYQRKYRDGDCHSYW